MFIIIRDGGMFRHILNFMRTGRPILPENFTHVDLLLEEAKYFELPGQTSTTLEFSRFSRIPSTFILLRTCVISGGASQRGFPKDNSPSHKWVFKSSSPPKSCSRQNLEERTGKDSEILQCKNIRNSHTVAQERQTKTQNAPNHNFKI